VIFLPSYPQVGILEWVPNTTPLKDIIAKEMGKDPLLLQLNPQALVDQEVDLMRLAAYEKRLLWIKSHDYRDYHKMYQKANRAQATDMYNHITSELSDDYIRRRFVNMAHTAEAYLTIRDQFAKSLAVSSLFGYVLGGFLCDCCILVAFRVTSCNVVLCIWSGPGRIHMENRLYL